MKLLATYSTSHTGYFLQPVTSMHAQMKHILQQIYKIIIPTLTAIIIGNTIQPKQGLNLVDLLQNVFHLCTHGGNQLPSWNCVCMNRHKQQQVQLIEWIISNFIARQLACHLFPCFYCDPYSLFKFLFISSLFTFNCTIRPHLSTLKLEIQHLYNLVMYVHCTTPTPTSPRVKDM